MKKENIQDIFVGLTFFSLYFIIFILFSFNFFTEEKWTVILFEKRFLNIPLIIYLFLFSFFPIFLIFTYFKIKNKRREKKIENALKMLNEGQYSAPIFLKMFSEETPIQINARIDKKFLELHKKIMLISEEAISSAQQVSKISNETKEEIVEGERHRIARELHDSVSQQLFAASMLLSAVQTRTKHLPEEQEAQIKLINEIIEEAQSEMRGLLLHLRPVKLAGKSFKEGIELLLDELESKVSIKIFHELEDLNLPDIIEDQLFRSIQELLSNVLRHAKAKELEVYFKKKTDYYQLLLVDDGDGFDMDEKKQKGFGLSNIKERIAGLGGTVRIISFPKQGTSVEIRIPLITKG